MPIIDTEKVMRDGLRGAKIIHEHARFIEIRNPLTFANLQPSVDGFSTAWFDYCQPVIDLGETVVNDVMSGAAFNGEPANTYAGFQALAAELVAFTGVYSTNFATVLASISYTPQGGHAYAGYAGPVVGVINSHMTLIKAAADPIMAT